MTDESVNLEIDRLLAETGSVAAGELAGALQVSRQAAHRRLRKLVESGMLLPEGAGRAVRYRRAEGAPTRFRFARLGLAEDRVWEALVERVPALAKLVGEAASNFHYAFTEMLNNAIDHAGAQTIDVVIEPGQDRLAFEIIDDGEGIFEHVRRRLSLSTPLEALQEISKGKVTTMPDRHTGEGIFFTSKIADIFQIDSGDMRWIVDNLQGDIGVGNIPPLRGTRVRFEAGWVPRRTLESLFAEYTDDTAFSTTRAIIRLFSIGVRFISRSEAKRLLRGLDRFEHVILDFKGVETVGQGFVDEVFRVWAREHPGVRLSPVNMGAAVELMVKRGAPR